jgi:hypothetical protein
MDKPIYSPKRKNAKQTSKDLFLKIRVYSCLGQRKWWKQESQKVIKPLLKYGAEPHKNKRKTTFPFLMAHWESNPVNVRLQYFTSDIIQQSLSNLILVLVKKF